MIDEPRQEQAALYVLGGLDAAESERFAAELRNDEELEAVVGELEATAAALAHAAPLRKPSANLKKRIFAEIRSGGGSKTVPFNSRVSWVPWALAASLAVCAGMLWKERGQSENNRVAVSQELSATRMRIALERDELNQKIAALETRQAQEIANLKKRDALAEVKIATLSAQVEAYSRALAVVVWDQNEQKGLVKLDKFPKAPTGFDFQLWVLDPTNKAPVSAGVVPVGPDGVARVAFQPTRKIGGIPKFAISVEKAGGAAQPTPGQIIQMGN